MLCLGSDSLDRNLLFAVWSPGGRPWQSVACSQTCCRGGRPLAEPALCLSLLLLTAVTHGAGLSRPRSACSAHTPSSRSSQPLLQTWLALGRVGRSRLQRAPSTHACFRAACVQRGPCKDRNSNFALSSPARNPQLLVLTSHSQKSPCKTCPATCNSESPSSSCSATVTAVRWKARKC